MQELAANAARQAGAITLYGADGFAGMRRAGALAALCLDGLYDIVAPGVTTRRIEDFVFAFALEHGAMPAILSEPQSALKTWSEMH